MSGVGSRPTPRKGSVISEYIMSLFIWVGLALLLDYLFSETPRYHPLIGFGRWASYCESRLNAKTDQSVENWRFTPVLHPRLWGAVGWLLAVAPCLILMAWLDDALVRVVGYLWA